MAKPILFDQAYNGDGQQDDPPPEVVAEFEAALDAEIERWLEAAAARLMQESPPATEG
jgi:hypothetical protein